MNRTRERRIARIRAERRTDGDQPTLSRIAYRVRSPAGPVITGDTSLTISAVWACIRYLSQGIAALPWQVRKPTRNGRSSEAMPLYPVQKILDRPSPETSTLQFRETLMSWALRRGNGYAEIERDQIGRPVALHMLHPDRVTVMRNGDGSLVYKVDNGVAPPDYLDAMDMFHMRGFGEGPVGLNVMAYAAESLGWSKAAQMFGASFFGNSATPSGIVTMKKPLSPEGLLALEDRFNELYKGPGKANRVAFLDNEMGYQSISTDPDKGQFIETNQFLLDEVCRWFGVPPHKIYNLLRATFSNIEHQSIEVVTDTFRPWARRFELEADYKLFGVENRQRLFTRFDFTDLLQGDTTTRLAYFRGLREIGVLSADEIREFEDMTPIGEADGGDKRVMQSQYTTLEMVGETPAAPVAPAAEPAPDDEPAEDDEPAPDDEPAANDNQAAETRAANNALARFALNVHAVKSKTVERKRACPAAV
jgi:HK97 family phage portal protein